MNFNFLVVNKFTQKNCCFPKTDDKVKIIEVEQETPNIIAKSTPEQIIEKNGIENKSEREKDNDNPTNDKNGKTAIPSPTKIIENNEKVEEKAEKKEEIKEFINTGRNFTDEEINNAPQLILEELTDKAVLRGNRLIINAGGLVNGNRKCKDGVAFFGRQLKKVFIKFKFRVRL